MIRKLQWIFTITLLTLFIGDSSAQKGVYVYVNHFAGDSGVVLNQREVKDWSGRTYKLSRVEYYLSGFRIFNGQSEDSLEGSYALINANSYGLHYLGQTDLNNADSLQFRFGVDSITNHADPTQWGQEHPLSLKQPSMHWGWAGGYRFIAMEGRAAKELNGSIDDFTYFEYHIVGDEFYQPMALSITPQINGDSIIFVIDADYNKILDSIDLSTDNIIHGGLGGETQLIRMGENMFSGKVFNAGQSRLLSVPDFEEISFSIYPNPITGDVLTISSKAPGEVLITDSHARTIHFTPINGMVKVDASGWNSGLYFVTYISESGMMRHSRIFVP